MTVSDHLGDTAGAAPSPVEATRPGPDPSWRGLYTAGGIAAFLYILLALVVPGLLFMGKTVITKMDATAMLGYIAEHRTWYVVLQSLVLETSILAIVTFAALFAALKHMNKGLAAVGALVTITCQILFMAYYPVLLGLVRLSDLYKTAAGAQRGALAAGAEALLAQNNAFNPVYESLFAAGILILSLVMLKGAFPRWVAYLGIATFPACVAAMALWPLIGLNYFWWWVFFTVWFVAAGWKLVRLGRETSISRI